MRFLFALCASCLILTSACVVSQEPAPAPSDQPLVTVNATAELLGNVLARVREQTGVPVAADPFVVERRITLEFSGKPLPEALDELAIAAVSTWDPAYLFTADSGPYGPTTTPPGWERPPQTRVTLSGGTGTVESIARTLTAMGAAPVGYFPPLQNTRLETQLTTDAALEGVLSQVKGSGLTWTRGYWIAPIDRAAVFGRYANLPLSQREALVLRHTDQMLRLNKDDVRQALEARHRQFSTLTPAQRAQEIARYADGVRAGIAVLNTLGPEARERARAGMRIFFDTGLEVYRHLTEEEQIETTPIIEAMGELKR